MTPLETLDAIHERGNLSLRVYMTNRERIANGLPIDLMHESGWDKQIILSGIELVEADLRGANINGVMLDRALLNRSDMTGASMRYVSATEADFVGVHLYAANMNYSKFWKSSFRLADMRYATLVSADMRRTDCTAVRFREADLDATDFEGADLSGAMLAAARNIANTEFNNARRRDGDRSIPGWTVDENGQTFGRQISSVPT